MDILSPEDRVILWRSTVDAAGSQREALLHAIAREVVDSLSSLNLYGSEYGELVKESLGLLWRRCMSPPAAPITLRPRSPGCCATPRA
jgi:hypothetical protein